MRLLTVNVLLYGLEFAVLPAAERVVAVLMRREPVVLRRGRWSHERCVSVVDAAVGPRGVVPGLGRTRELRLCGLF